MGFLSAIAARANAKRKKDEPEYIAPPEPMTPEAAQEAYGGYTPWREAAGTAATAAAGQLGAAPSPLLAMLRKRAMEGLERGGALSPEEVRAANQSGLSSWSARGLGRSPGAGYSRVLSRIMASNARKREGEAFAGGVAGMEQQQQQLNTGTLGAATESAYRGLELGEDIRRFGVNRDDALAMSATNFGMDLYTARKNAQAAQQAARQAKSGSILGGALGAIGSIGMGIAMK